MTKFGSKFFALALTAAVTITLSACGSIPPCNDELDECTYGGPYTEERTVQAGSRRPAPEPVVVQETVVVVEEPAPAHAPAPVIDDTPVMQSAEPQFTQISK